MASPLTHEKVPPHRIMTKAQAAIMMKREKIDDIERLPRILYTDPVLETLRLEGQQMEVGDVVEIKRPSLTTVHKLTWRVIVNE